MFVSVRRIVLRIAALSLVLCACGAEESAEPEEVSAGPAAAANASGSDDDAEDDDAEDDDDEPMDEAPEADVDHMDARALEAACFGGQQAACDQLGH